MKFDLILQNNASREFFILSGLQNTSSTELYLQFDDVEMPEGVQDGEYTYAVVEDDENELIFTPKTPILDTIITKDGEDIVLKTLCHLTGLMRVGEVENSNVYDDDHISFPYDGKKDNNSTIYYEG